MGRAARVLSVDSRRAKRAPTAGHQARAGGTRYIFARPGPGVLPLTLRLGEYEGTSPIHSGVEAPRFASGYSISSRKEKPHGSDSMCRRGLGEARDSGSSCERDGSGVWAHCQNVSVLFTRSTIDCIVEVSDVRYEIVMESSRSSKGIFICSTCQSTGSVSVNRV